jgi:histone H3/H4
LNPLLPGTRSPPSCSFESLFEDTKLCAIDTKGVTIMSKYIQLAEDTAGDKIKHAQ